MMSGCIQWGKGRRTEEGAEVTKDESAGEEGGEGDTGEEEEDTDRPDDGHGQEDGIPGLFAVQVSIGLISVYPVQVNGTHDSKQRY